jgi:hypothetical protein
MANAITSESRDFLPIYKRNSISNVIAKAISHKIARPVLSISGEKRLTTKLGLPKVLTIPTKRPHGLGQEQRTAQQAMALALFDRLSPMILSQ